MCDFKSALLGSMRRYFKRPCIEERLAKQRQMNEYRQTASTINYKEITA
jgi:hypothetical protein